MLTFVRTYQDPAKTPKDVMGVISKIAMFNEDLLRHLKSVSRA